MDDPRDCHTEWSKLEKYHVTSLTCAIYKEIMQMNLLTNQKETHRLREWAYGFQKEGWGEGIVRQFGMDMYTLLYFKWISNKDLQFCSVFRGILDGRRVWRRMDACICMVESLLCSSETITTLLISYTPIQNKYFKNGWLAVLSFLQPQKILLWTSICLLPYIPVSLLI